MDNNTPNADDYVLMLSDQLADHLGVCRAFVHLAMEAGCPAKDGMLSRDMLFRWLRDNWEGVRRGAGLPDLPPVSDCSLGKAGELQEGQAILTMLDFMHARACSEKTRDLCEELAVQLIDFE